MPYYGRPIDPLWSLGVDPLWSLGATAVPIAAMRGRLRSRPLWAATAIGTSSGAAIIYPLPAIIAVVRPSARPPVHPSRGTPPSGLTRRSASADRSNTSRRRCLGAAAPGHPRRLPARRPIRSLSGLGSENPVYRFDRRPVRAVSCFQSAARSGRHRWTRKMRS